ncbi:hypothetical protein ACLH0K_13765 [Arthrobacter sp. MPF02]|uniref:hypothetical protein n=1 Tax=Arthrobacter sp. MPF02 TaxID=3388492 RepID=UPI0039853C94
MVSASKTPLIAAILCVAIRVAILGWTRQRLRVVGWAATAAVLAFPLLQQLKLSADTSSILNEAEAGYPAIVQPVMPIIRRFDLFSAVTDATLFGPGGWMSAEEFWRRSIGGLIPQPLLLAEKIGVGTMWSVEIRSASLGTANSEVSLAEGFIAEGYALNGYIGVVLGATFMAIAALLVSNLISSYRPFLASLGMLLVSYPVLFERGIIGTVEVLGKSVQVAALMWLIYMMVSSVSTARLRVQNSKQLALPTSTIRGKSKSD